MNLVICESPGKVATITKYLNNNPALQKYGKFVVMASVGHIRDLPPKALGIDVNNGFTPEYQFTDAKKTVIEGLRKKAKEAKTVYLAADDDREGTFIAESVRVALGLGQNYKRIVFTEISSKALQRAIESPGKIDQHQLESQETRRILDRLVGFKLSPVLWKKFQTGGASNLSAGRVQSAVLHMIIKKEKEIEKFKPEKYWYFMGDFELKIKGEKKGTEMAEVRLYKGDTVYKEDRVENVRDLMKSLKGAWEIRDVKSKETKQKPDLPFITSTLQQNAGFGVKRTMQLAQELYEAGMITYHRTDSFAMSDDFVTSAQEYVRATWGMGYLGGEGDAKKSKTVKGAQQAHECIRPVDIKKKTVSKSDGEKISKDHVKLYDMIWKRTVAYFMKPCIYDELEIKIYDKGMKDKTMNFIAVYKKVKFNGFQIVYGVENEKYDFVNYMAGIKNGDYVLKPSQIIGKNTWSNPPGRYNETGLIKLMEAEGIGRPSTYSATLQKVTDRQYVLKSDVEGVKMETLNYIWKSSSDIKEVKDSVMVGAEKAKYVPTNIGKQVDEFLAENFEYIIDKEFTAHMEADMDKIAEGKKSKEDILKVFWGPFNKDLGKFSKIAKDDKVRIETEKTEFKIRGKTYIIRLARFGPVIEYQGDDANGKKSYIALKNYLKYVNKEYTDIDEKDIAFLLKLPAKVGVIGGKDVEIHMGMYGLYVKHGGVNVKISQKMIREFIETGGIDLKELEKYMKNK